MYQSWSHISFLHWRYPADDIQRLLPRGLQVELFDSDAWLGVTPFLVEHFRLRLLPPIPWLSRFPEINVRTYVKGPNGEPGIWFFSLEASPRLAVIGGRSLYGLPYRRANMSVERDNQTTTYGSQRATASRRAVVNLVVRPGRRIQPGELELFLTARFRLYSVRSGRLWFADVEHKPWPLREARISFLQQNLVQSLSIGEPRGAPLIHYSSGVHTKISRASLVDLDA